MLAADGGAGFMAHVVMRMSEAGARAASDGRHDAGGAWRYLRSVLAELTRDQPAGGNDQ